MPLTKKDIARLSGGDEYATYLLQGRAQFERGRASTVKQLRDIYSRTAAGVKNDIEGLTSGTLRHGHMTALEANLTKRTAELNRSILDAAHKGIWMGSEAGSYGPANISTSMLQSAFAGPDVQHLFAGINERATLAMLARTGRDGLMLSDRVWRIGEKYRNTVTTIVQDGVARGLDSRIMARELQKYLEPGTWTAHKLDTRQRLGVSKDVSYEAMRLARTELNNAFHEGMVAANQHVPGYLGVRWRLSHQHPVRDVCDDMANDRSHGEAGFYPRGYEPVRPHPQCFCNVIPLYEDIDSFTDRLNEWMNNPASQPDINLWYNNTGKGYLESYKTVPRR